MAHHIKIDCEIEFISTWHSGSGEGSYDIDRLIRRDSLKRPYIPATTLKGIIRQSCEKLARTLDYPDASDPHQQDLTLSDAFISLDKLRSPIDRLFGTKFVEGGVFIRDAYPKENTLEKTVTRNRIARYKILKTARDRHLFNSEYSLPGIYHTEINGWHTELPFYDESFPPYAYQLLVAGILAVDKIGGNKSSGVGWLNKSIKIMHIEYNGESFPLDEILDFDLLLHGNKE